MTALVRRFSLSSIGVLFSLLAGASACWAGPTPYLVDGDGDAVSDEIDECPYTHPGVQVNAKGCPVSQIDGDLDGVPDNDDDCPYTPPGAAVDAHGCAMDADFDGVANGIDRCPHTALSLPVNAQGCAKGEVAEALSAVTVASARKPKTEAAPKPLAVVVVPAQVPPVPAHIIAAPLALPPVTEPAAPVVAESPTLNLHFNYNTSRLGQGDLALLAAYAKVFTRRLAVKPSLHLHLSGYADGRETDVAGLAAARAAAVRSGLLMQGIAADRVVVESAVVHDGDAANNRRAEVKLGD